MPPHSRPDLDAAAATLYRAGWHARTIAAVAGRNVAWVYRALHRQGVPLRGRWRP